MLHYLYISSPLRSLTLVARKENLLGLFFGKKKQRELLQLYPQERIIRQSSHCPVFAEVKKQLKEYFSGQRQVFSIPLSLEGTEFQKRAWNALREIYFGHTLSYSEQAQRMGCKNAVRAVGSANGKNKISIIIPCHRVISKNGNLGGFNGGLNKKRKLLDLELS